MVFRKSNRGGVTAPPINNPVQKLTRFKTSRSMNNYPDMQNNSVRSIQEYNKIDATFTQGFRYNVNQGANPFTPVLSASGDFIYGIALTVGSLVSLADTQVNFAINNRNVLTDVNALLLVPNYTQGFLYFPTPQKLTGKDTFKLSFNKNDAVTIVVYANFIYKPQM